MSANDNTVMTLDEAVAEVLAMLTGQDLQYDPSYDRYQVIARQINRAQRSVALEREWSYFYDVAVIGTAVAGEREISLGSNYRIRQVDDDAARLINADGVPLVWAYFLPRDALHKYAGRSGLWCSVTRQTMTFSRRFNGAEDGLEIEAPIMREPINFQIPRQSEDPNVDLVPVPDDVREQEIDFPYPDLVVLRAAHFYAQSDPIMQPRVQTIEAQYKDAMYQMVERDSRFTDAPVLNEFRLGIESGIVGDYGYHHHPHADDRML